MKFYEILAKISIAFPYVWDKFWSPAWKKCMKHCGTGVSLRPCSSDIRGLKNLSIGDYTQIPQGSTIYCINAECIIGKKVLFGPNPTIITGDHRTDLVGKYIMDVTQEEKLDINDAPVIIGDEVWCGANVTILKGVNLGRGCVVAAGAVVTKSFPPYSIIGGCPAKLIRMRFSPQQIIEHEQSLLHNTNS